MNKSFFALLALTFTLVACKPQGVPPKERAAKPVDTEHAMDMEDMEEWTEEEMAMMDDMEHEMMDMDENDGEKVLADKGVYTSYTDGVIGNGQQSVLFFHASWCPYCIANDGLLKNFYSFEDYPRSVYKVDYDTSLDLKKQYGITQQDTFVLIDGNGNEIERISFPSEEALRDLLG